MSLFDPAAPLGLVLRLVPLCIPSRRHRAWRMRGCGSVGASGLEVAGCGGSQADVFGRVHIGAPVPFVAGMAQHAFVSQVLQDFSGRGGVQAEGLAVLERQLERGTLEVAGHDDEVVLTLSADGES